MSEPASTDHGAGWYDHVELAWAEGTNAHPPEWLTADWMPCQDCRANAFLRWDGERWHVTVAHDATCPTLAALERGSNS